MIERSYVAEAVEEAIQNRHLGTRIAFWIVLACASYLFLRIF